MRALVAAVALLALGACSSGGAGAPAQPVPLTAKELPPAPPPPALPDEPILCPADVRQCSDGRFVSRNPARGCAFDACPGENQ